MYIVRVCLLSGIAVKPPRVCRDNSDVNLKNTTATLNSHKPLCENSNMISGKRAVFQTAYYGRRITCP